MMNPSQNSTALARDVMTVNPICVQETDRVQGLQEFFAQHQSLYIPVLDQAQKLIGAVSYVDYIRSRQLLEVKDFLELLFQGAEIDQMDEIFRIDEYAEAYEQLMVHEIMSKAPLTLPEDAPLEDITRRMVEKRIHYAIVLDAQSQVLGVISALDIVQSFFPSPA